jgi:hypothetical protein
LFHFRYFHAARVTELECSGPIGIYVLEADAQIAAAGSNLWPE